MAGVGELLQSHRLLATSKVRHVRDDEVVSSSQQFRSYGHSLGRHRSLEVLFVALSIHRTEQEVLRRLVVGLKQASAQTRWIDERSQRRRIPKQLVQLVKRSLQILVALGQPQPLFLRCARAQTRAGDLKGRQIDRTTNHLPRRQRQVERGDLGAASVNLQTEQIVAQDRSHRRFDGEALFLHAQPGQKFECLDQEVTAAAARIEHAQVGHTIRPAFERSRRGPPRSLGPGRSRPLPPCGQAAGVPRNLGGARLAVLASFFKTRGERWTSVFGGGGFAHKPQIVEVVTSDAAHGQDTHRLRQFRLVGRIPRQLGPFRQEPARPPSAHRVVKQEPHHVRLSEQLGDGRQLVRPDLHLRPIHLILAVRLPELVRPAQRVRGHKHRLRQVGDQLLELLPRLRCQRHGEGRIVRPKDLRQHSRHERLGHLPAVRAQALPRQFRALLQRHRNAGYGFDQQPVLRQEPGEQHPVPVFVGDLVGQPPYLLLRGQTIPLITQLPPVRS